MEFLLKLSARQIDLLSSSLEVRQVHIVAPKILHAVLRLRINVILHAKANDHWIARFTCVTGNGGATVNISIECFMTILSLEPEGIKSPADAGAQLNDIIAFFQLVDIVVLFVNITISYHVSLCLDTSVIHLVAEEMTFSVRDFNRRNSWEIIWCRALQDLDVVKGCGFVVDMTDRFIGEVQVSPICWLECRDSF